MAVRFLKAGDVAKCKSCGANCTVPLTAKSISSDTVAHMQAKVSQIDTMAGKQQVANQSLKNEVDPEVVTMIVEKLADGTSEEEIVELLIKMGLTNDKASNLVRQTIDAKPENVSQAEAYRRKMISGALWAIGGTAVTAITYEAAQDGGVYLICWGAIVFGAWDFLCGLFGLMANSDLDVEIPEVTQSLPPTA